MAQPDLGRTQPGHALIPLVTFGLSLSLFFAISYLFCVSSYLLLPSAPISHALALFLPGFALLSWQSLFLGLAEAIAWGWYVTLIFVPLYNFFISRRG